MISEDIKIEKEYRKAFKTHDFDFNNPISIDVYTDYKCKNCGSILVQTSNRNYWINPDIYDVLEMEIKETFNMTCNQIMMIKVLT